MDPKPPSDEIPEAEAVPSQDPPRPRRVCPHCGSDNILKGLKLGLSGEVGNVGVHYKASGEFLGISLAGVEALRVNLCNSCGTVTRLYVKELDREWN